MVKCSELFTTVPQILVLKYYYFPGQLQFYLKVPKCHLSGTICAETSICSLFVFQLNHKLANFCYLLLFIRKFKFTVLQKFIYSNVHAFKLFPHFFVFVNAFCFHLSSHCNGIAQITAYNFLNY